MNRVRRIARMLWVRFVPGVLLCLVVASAALGIINRQDIAASGNRVMLVGQAAYRAWKWDRYLDSIPERNLWDISEEEFSEGTPQQVWGIQTNSPALVKWTLEIVPYFEREGVVENAVVPVMAAYIPGVDDIYHFNIAGQASCTYPMYMLNYRYHNAVSPWVERDELSTIVHELGHTQGICDERTELMEASNQVVTVEILAAMANDGNTYATRALLEDLRSYSMGYLWQKTHDVNAGWLYEWYATNIIHDAFEERARCDKSNRFWQDKQEDLGDIISAYQARPYEWAMAGLENDELETRPLVLGLAGNGKMITMDDLDYFLAHLGSHVRTARQAARYTHGGCE